MPIQRMVVCLLEGKEENQEEKLEVIIHIPTVIANGLQVSRTFQPALESLFEQEGWQVCCMNTVEEIRHAVERREVWTEEQRRAYRAKLKDND